MIERWKLCILYIGVFAALVFGLGGLEILLSRNYKEEQKKAYFELFGCYWYMPFVCIALIVDGIYTSLKVFFEKMPPSQEDFIFDIFSCILSILCLIGLAYNIYLMKEYMKNLIKD